MQREMVIRAKGGDFDAFTTLARASMSRHYAIATLILRDRDRAQDAVQEVLVSAWKGIRALRDPEAWDAWLHRLTVRACYQVHRTEGRRIHVELSELSDDESVGIPDGSMALAERDRLERLLGRLPIDQRAIIVLHFYIGLPLSDAAAVLDLPIGTAKSRLHRGLRSLRTWMGAEPGADPALVREQTA